MRYCMIGVYDEEKAKDVHDMVYPVDFDGGMVSLSFRFLERGHAPIYVLKSDVPVPAYQVYEKGELYLL